MKSLRIISLLTFVMLAFAISASAQVTVTNPGNTTPGLNPTYPDLATAITALNSQTAISGPVTITLAAGNPQTAPSGGYAITAALSGASATNTVTLDGTGNIITAPTPQASGVLTDAIFKFIGSDFMTLQNFVMNENAANTTTAAATNNMTEFGVALFYASTTNGAQNITIQNNTITLNRTYQNTFGIYSNSTHPATSITTATSATTTAGGNSGMKVYTNAINNVNMGVVVVGPTAIADYNTGIDIGGIGAGQGNNITNYGTTGTFSGFLNVSGTVNGVLVRNSVGLNISYNTIASSNGGVTSGTLNGIQIPAPTTQPTATFTNTVNNNNISLRSAVTTGAMVGITVLSTSASATSTLNINNNDFNTFGHTVAGASGTITFINDTATNQFTTINSNTFTNMSVNTTGSVTFISQSFTAPSNGTKNTNSNSIVTGFAKTGAGGTVTFIVDNGSTVSGAVSNCQNNNFSNGTLTGATAITGISYTDGGTAPTRTVTGNTINNWTTGAATVNAMNFTYWNGTSSLSNNTVTNIAGQGAITGITIGATVNTATLLTISSNTINNLVSSGAGGAVTGILCSNTSLVINISGNTISTLSSTAAAAVNGILIGGATTTSVFRNKIYDLSGSSASSIVNGILVSTGTTVPVSNNLIGDLRTPAANSANPLNGINVGGGTTVNVDFNTVYLNATSSGAVFGSSALARTAGSADLTMRSNILVNLSTANTTGLTVAYRRSSTTLTTYNAASNGNLFFAGTPSATNLIFSDTVNNIPTLAAYKAFVAPRDSTSVTENPPFLSTTGSSAQFLHISTAIATQVESGGVSVSGITVDFDGDTRSGTPDIGADEFTGVPLDLIGPAISYTAFTNTALTTNRNLTVTITDASGVAGGALAPRIYFRKNAGTYFSTQCTGSSPTYICTIDYSLVGGVVVSDVIDYFVVAQDTAGNVSVNPSAGAVATNVNTVTTPPTMPNTYTIVATFPASVTVGLGGDYPSLTNVGGLFEAMNAGSFTGNTVINITADLTGETGAVALNQLNQEGIGAGTYTVLIKPSGAPRTISGTAAIAVIRLNGADRVRIDGSTAATFADNIVGGTPALRELTIQNLSTSTTSGVIALHSNTNGAQNNIIRNTIVQGQSPLTTLTGISIGGAAITSGGTSPSFGSDNDNNRIENCKIENAQYGIAATGANTITNMDQGTIIQENDLASTGATRISIGGIFVLNTNNAQVIENSVGGISTVGSFDAFGISIGVNSSGVNTTTVATGGISNAVVTRNKVNGVASLSTTGFSAIGIGIAGTANGANVISNNMVTGVTAPSTSPDIPAGIYVVGALASNTRLYYNSVAMTGDRGTVDAQMPSYGIAITGTDPTVEMKNNIFYTTQTASCATPCPTALSYAIGMVTTTFANLDSNFNDFWSASLLSQDGGFRSGSLGLSAGTDYAALAGWNAAVGAGTDDIPGDSLEVDPSFVDPLTDLHLTGISSPLYDQGTPVSVLDDFDGQIRSVVGLAGGTPDIGADEALAPLAAEGSISGRIMAADGVGIRNAVITVTGGNLTQPIVVKSSAFGYYNIDGLDLGSTYVVTINSKRFVFANPSVVVSLQESVSELDFQANPQ